MRYYHQLTAGHFSLVADAQPVDAVLADPAASESLKRSLELVAQAREFAEQVLGFTINDSYTRYVELDRPYVVQNLYAAPEFSTELHDWCYPLVGCANYRGYFDQALLQTERDRLAGQGMETFIGGVTAYSTLGWFDDPVLSTFTDLPDYRLVGLVLHELAHQQVYVAGDTFFNESYATAVERAGLALFFSEGEQLAAYRGEMAEQAAITALFLRARATLDDLYGQPLSSAVMRLEKSRILDDAAMEYERLTGRPGASLALNNASLGAIAAYNGYVDGFLAMLAAHDHRFSDFGEHVARLAALDAPAREACMGAWTASASPGGPAVSPACQ